MRTLSEIKDGVANSYGMTWDIVILDRSIFDATVETVAIRYAEEVLKEATERARTKLVRASIGSVSVVDKDSILNIIKELK